MLVALKHTPEGVALVAHTPEGDAHAVHIGTKARKYCNNQVVPVPATPCPACHTMVAGRTGPHATYCLCRIFAVRATDRVTAMPLVLLASVVTLVVSGGDVALLEIQQILLSSCVSILLCLLCPPWQDLDGLLIQGKCDERCRWLVRNAVTTHVSAQASFSVAHAAAAIAAQVG